MPDDTTNDDVFDAFAGSPWRNPGTGADGAGADSADNSADAAAGDTDTGDTPADGDADASNGKKAKDDRGRWDKSTDWLEKQTNRLPPPAAKPFGFVFGVARKFRKTCGCIVAGCGCFVIGWLILFALILAFWLGGYGPGGSKSKVRHAVVVTPHSVIVVPPTAPGEAGETCAPPKHLVYGPGGAKCKGDFTPGFASPQPSP